MDPTMAQGEVRELWSFRTRSISNGVPTVTRGFFVQGELPDVAANNTGIPKFLDPHEDFPNLSVRNIRITPAASGSLVNVDYTIPELIGGSVPPVNQFGDGFIGKDVSFESEIVEVPLFQRQALTTTDNNGNPISLLVYGRVADTLPYRKRLAYYRVTIAIDLIGTTFEDVFLLTNMIVNQTDKIHTIFGEDLVFRPEGIDQQTEERFAITYRWYKDFGVPNTLSDSMNFIDVGPNLKRLGNVIYPVFDDSFIIPPYKGVRIHGDEDPTELPGVEFFELFERDENGWTSLPGV